MLVNETCNETQRLLIASSKVKFDEMVHGEETTLNQASAYQVRLWSRSHQ